MKFSNEKTLKFKNETWGSKYLFAEDGCVFGLAVLRPGDEIQAHLHETECEVFYFTKGTPILTVDGIARRVENNDAFLVEAGETHAIKNDTESEVKFTLAKFKK
ncbi:MAG: cupin domain-containing protein [bacterium]